MRRAVLPRPVTGTVVLIPVKAFSRAKLRLAAALKPHDRAALARSMAARVVEAAAPLPVAVVCDDDEVATWASRVAAEVLWTPGLGLNGAVMAGVSACAAAGASRIIVAHADLPFARDIPRLGRHSGVTLVPDRREDGTNVVSIPAACGFVFSYGPGSFRRHQAEVQRLGLRLHVEHVEHLAWDVDRPADLLAPGRLGRLPASEGT